MIQKVACPVPKEQRPINEYMKLVQSNFFNWPLLSQINLKIKIRRTFILVFILLLPFSTLFFDFTKFPLKFLLVNSTESFFFILLIIIRLFVSWHYIKQRLNESTIFYEESSWYDGQIWTKSKNILFQEKFIYKYQVLPILKKINYILLETFSLFLSFLILIKY